MDVVWGIKRRVEGEMVIMHDDEVELLTSTVSESRAEQNGAHVMVDEVGSPLEIKSSLPLPQNGEVSRVVEAASSLKTAALVPSAEKGALPEADPQEGARCVEEFGFVELPSNMRLGSETGATQGGEEPGNVQIERKFSCSEEASVDVHSGDSEQQYAWKDLKAVSIVDHALGTLQQSSDEFAGVVTQEVETEPTSAAKWSHEVSVDVDWVEVEMHSVAEPEASASGRPPGFTCDKPSPPGPVCVEPVNSNRDTNEHDAPSAIGVRELEKQGRELTSESLGIEEPTGTEREIMDSPSSTQSCFEKRKSMHLTEQQLPDSSSPDEDVDFSLCCPLTSREADESKGGEFVPTQVERITVVESSPCTSESPVLANVELTCERATDVDSTQGESHVKSTLRVPSFADWERVIEVDDRTTDAMVEEVLESTSAQPKQSEGIADITEHVQRIWSSENLKRTPLMDEPRAVTEQANRPVNLPQTPKFVGLSWPPPPLTTTEEKHYVDTNDVQRATECVEATDAIVAEPKEELELEQLPPDQGFDRSLEINIKEQNPHIFWSLKYLKTRPLMVEPRTVTQPILKPVKLKAPKVVGLSWPPPPLTATEDKHVVDTSDVQRAAECVEATDAIVDEELEVERLPPDQGFDGAPKANPKEQNPHILWNLKYLKTRPVMVEPRTKTQPILKPVKLKAPRVVGLSWPPPPLAATEDKHIVDTNNVQRAAECVGPTNAIVEKELEVEWSPPDQGFDVALEANIKEQNPHVLWSLKYLKTRPMMVEPRTETQPILKPVKVKAPKVVGLSWPPPPLSATKDKHFVYTNDVQRAAECVGAECVGATDAIVEEGLEVEWLPPDQCFEGALEAKEQNRHVLWSLKYLKTRPVMVEPRTETQPILKAVKLKAPKVVGLPWPPPPLTATEGEHFVDTTGVQRADCIGATDDIVAEAKEELKVEWSPPDQGFDGALEANVKEQNPHVLWSLKYLKARPVMVEPRTKTQPILKAVKLKARKVVGLPWPPPPLAATEDKPFVDVNDMQRAAECVGAIDAIVAEAKKELEVQWSPPDQGVDGALEANVKEQNPHVLWNLKYLKTRPVMVEPRTETQPILKAVKVKASKVVGLSWPPAPFTTAPGINGVFA